MKTQGVFDYLFFHFPWQLFSSLLIFVFTFSCLETTGKLFEINILQKKQQQWNNKPFKLIYLFLVIILISIISCFILNIASLF